MDHREHYRLFKKVYTLQARIEEMHDENSLVYEKLKEAYCLLYENRRQIPSAGAPMEDLLQHARDINSDGERAGVLMKEAMDIVHGYTNPNLTPPKEGN